MCLPVWFWRETWKNADLEAPSLWTQRFSHWTIFISSTLGGDACACSNGFVCAFIRCSTFISAICRFSKLECPLLLSEAKWGNRPLAWCNWVRVSRQSQFYFLWENTLAERVTTWNHHRPACVAFSWRGKCEICSTILRFERWHSLFVLSSLSSSLGQHSYIICSLHYDSLKQLPSEVAF